MRYFCSFAAIVFCLNYAEAQTLIQSDSVALQPQISRDADGFNVCGIRAVVLVDGAQHYEVHDFSVAIQYPSLGSMLKAGKSYVITPKNRSFDRSKDLKTVIPSPIKFWIAKGSSSKPLMMSQTFKSETPGFVIGVGEFDLGFETIMDIAAGEAMQFVTRYKDEAFDRVISFKGTLSASDSSALSSCINGMLGRYEASLNGQLNKLRTPD